MKDTSTKDRSDTEPSIPRHNTLGTWAVVAVLSAFLVAAGIIGYLGWTSTDTDVPTSGYVAMALGVIFSMVVGVGLMALIFYSSRKGYDEPAVLIQEPALHRDEGANDLARKRDMTRRPMPLPIAPVVAL
jgi:hypothetical protein